jgi:hypothetical protein
LRRVDQRAFQPVLGRFRQRVGNRNRRHNRQGEVDPFRNRREVRVKAWPENRSARDCCRFPAPSRRGLSRMRLRLRSPSGGAGTRRRETHNLPTDITRPAPWPALAPTVENASPVYERIWFEWGCHAVTSWLGRLAQSPGQATCGRGMLDDDSRAP